MTKFNANEVVDSLRWRIKQTSSGDEYTRRKIEVAVIACLYMMLSRKDHDAVIKSAWW